MTGNDVLKLLDAGFTVEEIRGMGTEPTGEDNKAAEAGSVDPPSGAAAEDKGAPESDAAASTQVEEYTKRLENKINELDGIIEKFKKNYEQFNIMTARNEKPTESLTGQQALAKLIAPDAIYTKGDI